MTTTLTDRLTAQPDASTAGPHVDPAPPGSSNRDRGARRLVVAGVFTVLLAAFAAHLAVYGAWIVDDAGISMAYAVNLAHGHGLVAQPGTTAVEGFSNPLWVLLFAALTKVGLFGRAEILGMPEYVVVTKALAIALQAVVLSCMAVVIRRVLAVVRRGKPNFAIFIACWTGAGLLLAANPSYVIWMSSGLENPLLAAEVAALAAVAMTTLPHPRPRAMVAIGGLCGLAALTRPDGIVYAPLIVVVALLAMDATQRQRARFVMWSGAAFACTFGAYLVFRIAYFGAWLPNTAVAKQQGLPSLSDLNRLADVAQGFGFPLTALAVAGGVAAWVTMRRDGNRAAVRVIFGGFAVLAAALAAYVVLLTDWMKELRFLTAAWPLLSVAAILGIAQLATLVRTQRIRVAVVVALSMWTLLIGPSWWDRAQQFADQPTISLCFVATTYGQHFNDAARVLDLDPRSTSVLLPDIGGVLLASDLKVFDLAGLTDREIARFMRDGGQGALADHILNQLRPTFIHIHDDWLVWSGLDGNPRLPADYVEVYVDADGAQEWVRRDALAGSGNPAAALVALTASARALENRRSPAVCAGALFG